MYIKQHHFSVTFLTYTHYALLACVYIYTHTPYVKTQTRKLERHVKGCVNIHI